MVLSTMKEQLKLHSVFSVDCVIFGFDGEEIKVLLIERGEEPYKDDFALPGDLVKEDEDLETAAGSVLQSLTGLKDIYMEQYYTFGKVNRHPLGRIITIAYYALVNLHEFQPKASSFAKSIGWVSLANIPLLGFDHNTILEKAIERLKWRVTVKPVGFELLNNKFTLRQIRKLYEAILEKSLDKRNFRRKILKMDFLLPLEEKQKNVAHKAARLYQFDYARYKELSAKGYNFDF